MSLARKHFWALVARGKGGGACPRKYGMNWVIPAVVSRRPDSGGAISDDEATRRCPRVSKNERNVSRMRSPSTRWSLVGRLGRPAAGLGHRAGGLVVRPPVRH